MVIVFILKKRRRRDEVCKSPLKGFQIGLTENGKKNLVITSYDVDHIDLVGATWKKAYSAVPFPGVSESIFDFIDIPCGQCMDCRLQYSRQWANRLMLERQYHDTAYFVTLTYDNKNIPRDSYIDVDTGKVYESYSLRKRDLQLFMKDLRYHFSDDRIRFYAAGEYGDNTFRPHYHLILFGIHIPDLVFFQSTKYGNYYKSDTVRKVWKKGNILICDCSWETCAYTARYVTKKHKGASKEFYELHSLEPEFATMSNKPGIARQYYEDHPDMFDWDYINVSTEKGGLKFKPPRYYEKLFEVDCPDESAQMKKNRQKIADDAKKLKLDKTSLNFIQLMQVESDNLLARAKSLMRNKN